VIIKLLADHYFIAIDGRMEIIDERPEFIDGGSGTGCAGSSSRDPGMK
jgi:hypothetical protein